MTSLKNAWRWVFSSHKTETIFWLVLAALYFCFALFHYIESTKSIPPFELPSRPLGEPESGVQVEIEAAGSPLDQPLQDFAHEFNAYLDEQNKSSSRANRSAACVLLLAFLTALLSAFREWRRSVTEE